VLLEHARALLAEQRSVGPMLEAGLATAELQLYQGALPAAQAAAEEALRLATDTEHHREEALARGLLGQCALASDAPADADAHLRAVLAMQMEMGATLEAARTRLALAEAVLAGAQTGCIPEEARMLLAQSRAQFLASGAVRDLRDVERVEQVLRTLPSAPPRDATAQARPSLPAQQRGVAGAPVSRCLARTERQAWALEQLRTAGPLSPRAYATALAVSVDTALRDLQELVDRGLVRAAGTTKDRRYLLAGDDVAPAIHRTAP